MNADSRKTPQMQPPRATEEEKVPPTTAGSSRLGAAQADLHTEKGKQ